MKLRSVLSCFVLIAFLCAPFLVCESFASKPELDEITKVIKQKEARWAAKDTSISKLTAEERKKRLGSQFPTPSSEKRLDVPSVALPLQLDWRNYNGNNYVTPVKEQGTCGACWAFATTATLESKELISQNTPGIPIDLSEQILTSCSGAGTCAAGSITAAADYLSNLGLPPESFYPYAESDGFCAAASADWEASTYKISGWSPVNPTVASIKTVLYNYGPLVTLMAVQTDFYYYGAGIYTYGWGSFEGYHAALIVGYDDVEQYFIVKSSWGTDWGEAGYFRIAYSEMNSPASFGAWAIAYNNALAADFPIIDGIARDMNGPATTSQGSNETGNGNNGTENPGQSGDNTTGNNGQSEDKNNDNGKGTPAGTTALTGTIKDESGNFVSGAEIKTGKLTAITDDKGLYLLSALAAGDYLVTVAKDGYALTAADVSLPPDATITKDFVLLKVTEGGPKPAKNKKQMNGPGWILLQGEPITPAEAEAHYQTKRKTRAAAQSGTGDVPLASAASDFTSPEIQELARALRYDPKLIYDYVHQNIIYLPYFGSLKGALLTYLDGSGNDFDQASLMIALLRASGYTAQYVYGNMELSFIDLRKWLRDTYYVATLSSGGIPYNTTALGASVTRVWVKAMINGQAYHFDPALKFYENGVYLDERSKFLTDTGYVRDGFMSEAMSGAMTGTDYVQNVNEGKIKAKLADYTSRLIAAIRSSSDINKDVSAYMGISTLIKPSPLSSYAATLPQNPIITQTWDEIPPEYTATLRIEYSGINYLFNVPDIGGRRITITHTGAYSIPELRLEGALVATGAAPGTGKKAKFTIDHGIATNAGYYASQWAESYPKSSGTYAVITNFAGTSQSQLLKKRQERLSQYLYQGLTPTTDKEKVLGEMLNIMGLNYFNEVLLNEELAGSGIVSGGAFPLMFHGVGVMCQETGYHVDIAMWAMAYDFSYYSNNEYAGANNHNLYALFQANQFPASALEHGILEQSLGSDKPAVSTVKVLQMANTQGHKIFQADNANYQSIKQQLKNYPANAFLFTDLDTKMNSGESYKFVIPEYGNLTLGLWQGSGYMWRESDWVSGMMVDNLNGGVGTALATPPYDISFLSKQLNDTLESLSPVFSASRVDAVPDYYSEDPVDMASGAFIYDRSDLVLGGAAPRGLSFARSYNSNVYARKRQLGYGWTHNYDIYLSPGSNAAPMWGSRQATEAAALIVANYIINDVLRAESHVKDSVVAAIIAKWALDLPNDNSVNVDLGNKNMEFIKLADGTYSSPPGIATQLSKNGNTFTLQERFGTQIIFNSDNKVQSLTDVDGNTMVFTYSGGNLASVRDVFGRTLTLSYSGDKITMISDSAGRSVSFGYNGDDLASYTDPESKVWGYGYDTNHRMTSLRNPLNITTAINVYDTLGRVKTQTAPRQGGATATYNFYFSGYRNQEEDPDGHTTTYYYDNKGRAYAVENAIGYKTTKVFDGQDHTVSTIDPRSNSTTYLYDNNHNLTCVTNALNYSVNNAYDSQYRLTDTNDPLSHNTHFTYDSEHHLTETRDALGNAVNASHYGTGLKNTATDGRNTTTAFTYNSYGNPQTTITAGHPAINYSYDPIGRMTGLTDQVGSSTGFVYDKRNLTLSKTDPLGGISTYAYDNVGRLASKNDRNANTVTYDYTPSDKLEMTSYPGGTSVQFTYNRLDNLVSIQDSLGTSSYVYDAANRLTSMTNPFGFAVSYQYDATGNVAQITYPGNKIVSYTYDALNSLKTVTNWLSQTAIYTYDAAGRLTYFTNFNGTVTTYGYDNANRLTSLENKTSGSSVISNYQFTLDGNGNRTEVMQNEPLAPSFTTGDTSYTYNNKKNRLLSAAANTFAYDYEGRINTGYGANYSFDYEHRLTGIGTAYQFSYDGRGNRLQATRNGTTTRYIYDTAGNLIAEADGSNNITRYYIYGQGLLAMVTPSDQVYCYHDNATGSTIAMTDASQNVLNKYAYDPFGNIAAQVEAVPQPFKFAGQFGVMIEPNGFYYMRARYYDPQVSRFISEDPTGFEGGDVNLYAYVGNNQVNRIDPWGLAPGDPFYTMDTAGIDAILYISPQSISQDREYGGWVYRNLNSSYSYTTPNPGTPTSTTLGPKPSIGIIVGDYHTHGAYNVNYDNENFSPADKRGYSGDYSTGYLGTPNGTIKKYNAITNEVTTLISGNLGSKYPRGK